MFSQSAQKVKAEQQLWEVEQAQLCTWVEHAGGEQR